MDNPKAIVSLQARAQHTLARLEKMAVNTYPPRPNQQRMATRLEPLQVITQDGVAIDLFIKEIAGPSAAIGESSAGRIVLSQAGLDADTGTPADIGRMLVMREVIARAVAEPGYGLKQITNDLSASGIDIH